jgi:hypothetical protein
MNENIGPIKETLGNAPTRTLALMAMAGKPSASANRGQLNWTGVLTHQNARRTKISHDPISEAGKRNMAPM